MYTSIFTDFSLKPGTQNTMNSVDAGILQNQYTLHMAVQINSMFAVVPTNSNFAALVLHFVPSRWKKNIIVRISST